MRLSLVNDSFFTLSSFVQKLSYPVFVVVKWILQYLTYALLYSIVLRGGSLKLVGVLHRRVGRVIVSAVNNEHVFKKVDVDVWFSFYFILEFTLKQAFI